MNKIAFIVTTDGRGEFLERTIPSWDQAEGEYVLKCILDDSGDAEYRGWLKRTFEPLGWHISITGLGRQGYNAAMRRMREIGVASGADFILHVEDDFLLNRPVNLYAITSLMANNPRTFAQMAFIRQPWYQNEVEHGGVIQALQAQGCHFDQKTDGTHHWLEHRTVWTANPNLMPVDVARIPYPEGDWSESAFMRLLRETTSLHCAYYGRLSDDPMVTHIGEYKKGTGY